jgi:hypothetical protein
MFTPQACNTFRNLALSFMGFVWRLYSPLELLPSPILVAQLVPSPILVTLA